MKVLWYKYNVVHSTTTQWDCNLIVMGDQDTDRMLSLQPKGGSAFSFLMLKTC